MTGRARASGCSASPPERYGPPASPARSRATCWTARSRAACCPGTRAWPRSPSGSRPSAAECWTCSAGRCSRSMAGRAWWTRRPASCSSRRREPSVPETADRVEIVEVSPRDGLQNERRTLSTADKVELVARARQTGVRRVEVTSFVRPDRVPQLADAAELVAGLAGIDIVASALALNLRGYERAVDAGIREINTLVLTTETFSERNQGMSTAAAIASAAVLRERARAAGVRLTITIGASFGCPFEGEVSDARFAEVLARVCDLGADEIALADTIGVAVPTDIERRFALLHEYAPATPTRVHLHDTRNTGIANAVAAVRSGVKALD